MSLSETHSVLQAKWISCLMNNYTLLPWLLRGYRGEAPPLSSYFSLPFLLLLSSLSFSVIYVLLPSRYRPASLLHLALLPFFLASHPSSALSHVPFLPPSLPLHNPSFSSSPLSPPSPTLNPHQRYQAFPSFFLLPSLFLHPLTAIFLSFLPLTYAAFYILLCKNVSIFVCYVIWIVCVA